MITWAVGNPGSQQQAERAFARLSLAELVAAVRVADPSAFLILPRILRRVVKQHRDVPGLGFKIPHYKSYVIDRAALGDIVAREELDLAPGVELPERVILIARPSQDELATTPAGTLLVRYWRLLFHARIHAALEPAMAEGRIAAADLRRRIHQIGATEFDEIRAVLTHDGFLLPPGDDWATYVEFAAVYLELRQFVPSLVSRYFPALENPEAIDRLLGRDVDFDRLLQAARPEGAPDPEDRTEAIDLDTPLAESAASDPWPEETQRRPSERRFQRWLRRAEKEAAAGNIVGSAIYRARAERYAPERSAGKTHAAIRTDINRLIRRLKAALEIDDPRPEPWQEPLIALVKQTPRGIWTIEARLLYDLQKVCVDYERDIYTVDLVEWALSWGRRPVRRALPNQRDVLMSKHLQSAARRLTAVRISDGHRHVLSGLLRAASQCAEARVRERFRPLVAAALVEVGLVPQNLPERVARNKLIEELLDRIVERDFLTLGDLRDALSRNNLKLPDFAGVSDLVAGDPLLRANRRLAISLDGVCIRGEVYLRWMQQLSSLAFGTRTGRFLTRYVGVPFGGAYVALAGLQHLVDKLLVGDYPIKTTLSVVSLGVFLLGLLNVERFRRGVWQRVKTAYRASRAVLVDFPVWLVHLEPIQRVLQSRVFRLGFRFVLKPLVVTAVISPLIPMEGIDWQASAASAAGIFVAASLALNSRLGRTMEEMVADWIVQGWQRFGVRIITGLFYLVMDLFRGILQTIERLLYTVDEWLRFKSGESQATLVVKAALGVVWFGLTYIIRFCVTVLIEPQVNPIKHFPVVTVSHKFLLPLIPTLANVLALTMETGLAYTVATTVIAAIPGIFGFLVWELKGNWRLYAANRPNHLEPVAIGRHGETMIRLLKPGFHSGTLPKRYAKLRRAERAAREKGNWRAARKHFQALQRQEEAICRYVEREFVQLFAESPGWEHLPFRVGAVSAGSNRVRIAIHCPALAEDALRVTFEAKSGWMVAEATSPGWFERLPRSHRQMLETAMGGLMKMAGIDLVRRQIEQEFPPPPPAYEVVVGALAVWPDPSFECEVRYSLENGAVLEPQVLYGVLRRSMPVLARSRVVFSDTPVRWQEWIEAWK